WLQDCVDNHENCRTPSFMPKRLIDVGGDSHQDLCLREDMHQETPYIAVSHSWKFSEARKFMTLKDNYESRKQYIPWQGLSKTFRDVIDICRWPGVRHVWIDTFCIIQDNAEDWADQASQMGCIYEGAYITIAVDYDPD
ncbi:hypothetical protein ASPWEDRAFT_95889, partial [Aspergillus wentii DTO 134E9]